MSNEMLKNIELDDENIEAIDETEDIDEMTEKLLQFTALVDAAAKGLIELKTKEEVNEFLKNDPGVKEAINWVIDISGEYLEDADDRHDAMVLTVEFIIFLSRVLENCSEKGRQGYETFIKEEVLSHLR